MTKRLPVLRYPKPLQSATRHVTRREIVVLCDIHPGLLDRFVQLGLVDPARARADDGEPLFSCEVVPLIRKVRRLRNELGVSYASVGVVLELLARIEAMEARIEALERQVSSEGRAA